MKDRKLTASLFILIALILGTLFWMDVVLPTDVRAYFRKSFYGQFGPLAMSVELLAAGASLFTKHEKANFALALFGFTVVLDSLFTLVGLFASQIPLYANIVLLICAIIALGLAFTDTYKLGRISWVEALWSFILGNAVELFFNFW